MTNKVPKNFWLSIGGGSEYQRLFNKAGFKQSSNLSDADICVFTGGSDVNPVLYGESARPETHFSLDRDKADLQAWRGAKNKLKVGICRGGQFLNVMNGGKLWQHVDNHCHEHELTDQFNNRVVTVSSTHHQMFRPAHHAVVIGLARKATFKYTDNQTWKIKNDDTGPLQTHLKKDYEVLWYPMSQSLCFQPHPEFEDALECRDYFYSVLRRIIDGTIDNEVAARKESK